MRNAQLTFQMLMLINLFVVSTIIRFCLVFSGNVKFIVKEINVSLNQYARLERKPCFYRMHDEL